MRSIHWFCLSLAVVALAASSASAQNLLVDPGFEDASKFTADGPPFVGFWEAFSGGGTAFSTRDDVMPRNGGFDAHLSITASDNNFAGLFQDVAGLSAGQQLLYTGWNKSSSDPAGYVPEFRIEWRNSVSNSEIARTPNSNPTVGAQYSQFSLQAAVPAGADTARLVYAIQTFGDASGANTGEVFLDDFAARVVPEPATGVLAAVGVLAALRRRRS